MNKTTIKFQYSVLLKLKNIKARETIQYFNNKHQTPIFRVDQVNYSVIFHYKLTIFFIN